MNCYDWQCKYWTQYNECTANDGICWRQVHNPAPTSAGQVGSSVLLVAREGDQQLDTTASQLGPLVARDELIDKSGGARCNAEHPWGMCGTLDCEQCIHFY